MAWVLHRIRPPDDLRWVELFRMTDDWDFIPDDGEPGIAFAGKALHENGNWYPLALGYQLRDGTNEAPFWVIDRSDDFYNKCHLNSIAHNAAMNFCLRRYGGAANGRHIK
jgi:hypothetical protein